MGRRILAILAAFVLALVGAVLVLLYARGADQRALEGAQPTTVYVSQSAVPAGRSLRDALAQNLISKTQLAAKAVPAGALTTVDQANEARVAVADIPPGTYLLQSQFGSSVMTQRTVPVPPGMLAISVSLTDPQRVGTFVTPGSYITIFETYAEKKFGTDPATKQFNDLGLKATSVLLSHVQVIGMGSSTQLPTATPTGGTAQNGQTQGNQLLVTVAVAPQDSVRLVHAINQ